MIRQPRILFMGTAKSGLGHLRRLATIARQVNLQSPGIDLVLMTNAAPAGLSTDDLGLFSRVWVCERSDMAARLAREGCDLAVLDTLQLPGFEAYSGPAALILRETPLSGIAGFQRAGGGPGTE